PEVNVGTLGWAVEGTKLTARAATINVRTHFVREPSRGTALRSPCPRARRNGLSGARGTTLLARQFLPVRRLYSVRRPGGSAPLRALQPAWLCRAPGARARLAELGRRRQHPG